MDRSNHVMAARAARELLGRLLAPLLVCIGLALLVLGGAAQASAPVSSDASATHACDGAHGPTRLLRDLRDPGSALVDTTEPENQRENEDEDASEIIARASAYAAVPAGVLHLPRPAEIDSRRRWVSTGLGRGPPQRRR